jgi:ribosomal protein L7/L12
MMKMESVWKRLNQLEDVDDIHWDGSWLNMWFKTTERGEQIYNDILSLLSDYPIDTDGDEFDEDYDDPEAWQERNYAGVQVEREEEKKSLESLFERYLCDCTVETNKSFRVVLLDAGDKKIKVIRELCSIASMEMKQAKEIADGVPQIVVEGISKVEASQIKIDLEEIGATVKIE